MRALILSVALAVMATTVSAADFVAQRTLRVGTILDARDIAATNQSANGRIADLVGLELRRTVYAGRAIAAGDLGPPTLVHRNDIVTITFSSGALGIRTEGRALGSGGLGERIEVMNLDTRIVVRATVTGKRQAEVRP